VLSFGWEFAPVLSGGLGVACAGLARALADEGVDLTFVLPKLPRPVEAGGIRVVSARELAPQPEAPAAIASGVRDELSGDAPSTHQQEIRFESLLAPYQTQQSYHHLFTTTSGRATAGSVAGGASTSPGSARADASLYGGDLLREVERLAAAASAIAATTAHDVIHCHDWMTFAAGVAARKVSGKPLVLHVHSTEGDRSGGGRGSEKIRELEEAGLCAADRIVAVSDFTRRAILEQYPAVSPDKLRVVHNGTEPAHDAAAIRGLPPLAGERPVVLFLGRLTAQKGPEWFLRAAALVRGLRPETIFVVAGSGELLPEMVERAAELGLASSLFFTGFLSGDDISRAYAMADVFVMPSVSEPFGLVPIEAMLRGTPAIVSRQSGVSEVIRHCLKVDFWETEELADKIIGVIDHAALASSLGAAGRKEALRLGWQAPARRLLEVFDEVAAASDATRPVTGETR
jgi:glycosyltransferase involved in cell wall biosynthesis